MTRLLALLSLLLLAVSAPARAEVTVTFWSHDRDRNYEHAFIVMRGSIDATGERVDTSVGFTARRITPGILLGSVQGMMEAVTPEYMARPTSRPHFAVRLDDAGYARLQQRIAAWAAHRQPSYHLNRRNCVHFIMDMAAGLGLAVNRRSAHFREPRAFLGEVMRLNPALAAVAR